MSSFVPRLFGHDAVRLVAQLVPVGGLDAAMVDFDLPGEKSNRMIGLVTEALAGNIPCDPVLFISNPCSRNSPSASSLFDATIRRGCCWPPAQMDEEFWRAYRALDRSGLFESTLEELRQRGEPMTLSVLAKALPPTHDLETLTYWSAMAREAGIEIRPGEEERIDIRDEEEGETTRFFAPMVALSYEAASRLNPERIE